MSLFWCEEFLAECVECDVCWLVYARDDRRDCNVVRIHLRKGRSVAIEIAMMATPGSMVDHTEMLVAFP